MSDLSQRVYDEANGLEYVLHGVYYPPDLKFPEEHRPIGKWGRMHRDYLRDQHPAMLSELTLSGKHGAGEEW